MTNEASKASPHDAEAHNSSIRLARAQTEAARSRQLQLTATGQLPAKAAADDLPKKSLPGYTLVRELHRGGQGIVYLAVQESTDRQVAIKLLNRELPSGSGSAGLARFEREIEILSRLKHPNIVTVHDCSRNHGHVYLVMDYVNGQPLDLWVNRDEKPTSSTLEVFAKVCDGVNAAHLRGIIHRDLKPGNILVDERGEPHVVDFGLAKLVEDHDQVPNSAAGPMTVTGQFVGSLPWSSPEQAEGRTDELDIRSDVYSLGVILYQLLTGRFPYAVVGRLRDVVQHIAEADPTRPSILEPTVDRELETIVLKCLAKEPERRYQSAGEVARDIRRYLAGEAIEARRDSLVYLMSKRLARYRVAAITAAAMLVVVLSALVVSIAFWRHANDQSNRATDAAMRADHEADQARTMTEFMREVLTSVHPENLGADVRLMDVLRNASVEASERFADHPQQEAEVRTLFGQVYNKLSLWTEARNEYAQATQLWRRSAGPEDDRTLEAESLYASTLLNLEDTVAAERVLRDLVPKLERKYGADDRRTLAVQPSVAFTHLYRRRIEDAEQLLLKLRAHPALRGDDAMQIRILSGLINVIEHKWSMADREQLPQLAAKGEAYAQERVALATSVYGPNSLVTWHAEGQLADFMCWQGRYDQAAEICQRLMAHPFERIGECHQIRSSAMSTLAEALHQLGQDNEAADLQLRRLACVRQRFGDRPPLLLSGIFETLRFLDRAQRATEGEALAREVSTALQNLGGGHGDMKFAADQYIAHFVSMQGRADEAERLFQPLISSPQITDARVEGRLHLFYAHHLIRRGLYEQAESELTRSAAQVGGVKVGTWDSHADDIILGYVALYSVWSKPEQLRQYEQMRDEMKYVPNGAPKQNQAASSGGGRS